MPVYTYFITLKPANVKHGHIYLSGCMDAFPADTFGGANKTDKAPRTIEIQCGSQVIHTDIDRKKRIFRKRGWVRRFFKENRLTAGQQVLLERLTPYSFRITTEPSFETITCLSIQQPWADLILDGKKLVENRTWDWSEFARRLKAGEAVYLGIHASKQATTWHELSAKEREYLAPGWKEGDSEVGAVLGIVELGQMCQPRSLPACLRYPNHKYTIDEPRIVCWVLQNPRKLLEAFPAKGNVKPFDVDIPSRLLPPGIPSLLL